jgi:hypothetical protein
LTLANNDGLSRTGIKSKVAVKEKPLIVSDPQHVSQVNAKPAPIGDAKPRDGEYRSPLQDEPAASQASRDDTRAIQHYLGHRSIASTVRYTALASDRFKGFWKD